MTILISKRLTKKEITAQMKAMPKYVDPDPTQFTEYDQQYAKKLNAIWEFDFANRIIVPTIPFPGYPFQQPLLEIFDLAVAGSHFHKKIIRLLRYAQFIINVMILEDYYDEELEQIKLDAATDKNNPLRDRVLAFHAARKMFGPSYTVDN